LGINIKFLELDEIDAPLDEDGVEALMNIIRKIQHEYKILLITHNSSLKHFFTHAIVVENDVINGSKVNLIYN